MIIKKLSIAWFSVFGILFLASAFVVLSRSDIPFLVYHSQPFFYVVVGFLLLALVSGAYASASEVFVHAQSKIVGYCGSVGCFLVSFLSPSPTSLVLVLFLLGGEYCMMALAWIFFAKQKTIHTEHRTLARLLNKKYPGLVVSNGDDGRGIVLFLSRELASGELIPGQFEGYSVTTRVIGSAIA